MRVSAKLPALGVAALMALPVPALASDYFVKDGQSAAAEGSATVFSFNKSDLNRNGVLDMREIRAAFGDQTQDIIMAFDANADACITKFELRAYYDRGRGGPDGVLWERVRR